MSGKRTTNLKGKCATCRYFTIDAEWECTGFCSGRMKHKGRLERTYKCRDYAPTIIEAEGRE